MDSVEKFATHANAFAQWLMTGIDSGRDAVRECLNHLLGLYQVGLALPSSSSTDDDDEEEADLERVGDVEWRKAYDAAARLPMDMYSEVFDPTAVPGDPPVVGSLADDLADIYRDVVTGLRVHRRGDSPGALEAWTSSFYAHWGTHATSAIRALHWWLVNDGSDSLRCWDEGGA